MDFEEKAIFGGFLLLVVVIIGGAIYLANQDAKEWAAFSKAHACKIVGQMDGSVGTGFAGGKVVITTTPGKTGWLCDDGVTYWRDK